MIVRVCSEKDYRLVGKIDVDADTGACIFVDGEDPLKRHVDRSMRRGIFIEGRRVLPSDGKRFETALDCVLSHGGFCTADIADSLRSKGVTLSHVTK